MTKTTKTAIGLLALYAAIPGAVRAQADDDELLLAPAAESAMSLKFSGFADLEWARFFTNGDPRWKGRGIPENSAFSVGNLNLYMDGRLDKNWRSLIEIRFTYLPAGVALQGQSDPLSTGTGFYTDTQTYDYAQLRAKTQWGGIVIERAWLEYRLHQVLTLRAGHFLTPYGIWNVDHGSPTIIDIAPPFVIGQELFPRSQVGLELYGSVFLGSRARLGYHATVSNGRIGHNPAYVDLDSKYGWGGRFFLELGLGAAGELKLGYSTYGGRNTDRHQGLEVVAAPVNGTEVGVLVPKTTTWTGDEWDQAVDAKWELGGLTLQGEYFEQRLRDEQRTVVIGSGASAVTSSTRQDPYWRRGWYGLVGYRLPLAIMPFAVYQYISDSRADWQHDSTQDAYEWTLGVNWRVRPNVVLKASYSYAWWPRTQQTLENKDPLKWLATQVAWAF
jgi:opacity protein-like surface antigen